MTGSRWLAAWLCLAWLLPACTGERTRDVRVDVSLAASCGFAAQNYDISCVSSIEVRAVGQNGALLAEECTAVTGAYGDLGDLVSASPRSLLDDLPVEEAVVVELRGYSTSKACEGLAESALIFWGESALVDLRDLAVTSVTVDLECRPECSCAEVGDLGCEVPLQPGVCAPIPTVLCRRPCADATRCFGGELQCVGGRCQPEPRGLCAECTSGAECDSGICVRNENTGEAFCGPRCPSSVEGRIICPELMSCRRLDGDPFTRQ